MLPTKGVLHTKGVLPTRLSSVESGPRLPSEKSGHVAAARVAAAGALVPAGVYGVNAGMARARGKAAHVL